MIEPLKCLVIGPPVCGKTSLIHTYMSGSFRGYIPNIPTRYDVNFICKSNDLNEFKKPIQTNESIYFFKIFDYEIDKTDSSQFLKEDELNDIDVIILCYKSGSRSSRDLVRYHYKRFLKSKWPRVPILLLSCLSDLLTVNPPDMPEQSESLSLILDYELREIPETMLPCDQELMMEIGAQKHLYCSSLENFNIDKAFSEAFKMGVLFRLTEMRLKSLNNTNQRRSIEYVPPKVNINQELKIKKPIEVLPLQIPLARPLSSPILATNKELFMDKWFLNNQTPSDVSSKSSEISNLRINNLDEKYPIYKEKIENEKSSMIFSPKIDFLEEVEEKSTRTNSVNVINAFKKVLTLFGFACLFFYFLTYRYCLTNRQLCDEIYELSLEVIDDSVSSLNESYIQLVAQINKFSIVRNS